MDKFSFIALWDTYRGLLTPVQQEITDKYFNLDLTVSEIAQEKGISRQAVSDCLKICKSQLEDYEDKLHLYEALRNTSSSYSLTVKKAARWAEDFKASHPEFTEEANGLLSILKQ